MSDDIIKGKIQAQLMMEKGHTHFWEKQTVESVTGGFYDWTSVTTLAYHRTRYLLLEEILNWYDQEGEKCTTEKTTEQQPTDAQDCNGAEKTS